MRNALAAAVFLLLGPGLALPVFSEEGGLVPVTSAKSKVACKSLNCSVKDYNYVEISEEELDALDTMVDEAVAERETLLKRKLTEKERDAVANKVIKSEFNRRVAEMEKASGRRFTKHERGVMYEEFLGSIEEED